MNSRNYSFADNTNARGRAASYSLFSGFCEPQHEHNRLALRTMASRGSIHFAVGHSSASLCRRSPRLCDNRHRWVLVPDVPPATEHSRRVTHEN